jgi:sugar O-acyltransferase (sialic acid O-acetyltransferase NeuD family)
MLLWAIFRAHSFWTRAQGSRVMQLFILGSSGHAREIAVYAESLRRWSQIIFVDNEPGTEMQPWSVSTAEYQRLAAGGLPCESIIGGGSIAVRRRMANELVGAIATIVADGAHVLGTVGVGSVVAPGAVIAPNAVLAQHVLLNYNAAVGHDARIGSLVVVAPLAAISGWCVVEDEAYIGAGSVVRERLHVGNGAIVGMGAVVTKDVPPHVTAVGVPARWYSPEPEVVNPGEGARSPGGG